MVALARTPGPKALSAPLMPSRGASGPFTTSTTAAPPVLVATPW